MNQYTNQQIEDTLKIIDSTIKNCEKIKPKFEEKTSQYSLLNNRIKALYISKALITNQKHKYTQEELANSVAPITSIINKSEKAISNHKEKTATYTRLRKIIDAMTVSLAYIEKTIK